MENGRPETLAKYLAWLKRAHGARVDARTRNHYESVASRMRTSIDASPFWAELTANLKTYHEEYLVKHSYDLLLSPSSKPMLVLKPYDSFLLKTHRRNVLDNDRWPEEPTGGWLVPSNWYSNVGDIVRTVVVVKYLDGVSFLSERIAQLAESHTTGCAVSFEAREEGYYAAHMSVSHRVDIPRIDWDTEWIDACFEIQVTTQLQEVIRSLLHKYYERRRSRAGGERGARKWQWDYESDEFVTNYLGHILHYVEGMIMDARRRPGASTDRPNGSPMKKGAL